MLCTLPGKEERGETKLIVPHIMKRETEAQRGLVQVHTSRLIQGLLVRKITHWLAVTFCQRRNGPGSCQPVQATCPSPDMSSTEVLSTPEWMRCNVDLTQVQYRRERKQLSLKRRYGEDCQPSWVRNLPSQDREGRKEPDPWKT